ncbi:unnamed protein product [Clonostachys byssicola]|uniref:CBM1 domain-containing protein n=1 Tax=Clonostachys byssicola TaxID=160290 RepID=A0A9N9UFD3_9HYPO|nr:unnamed protein product [Clonostachys byssicola]
MFSMVGSTALLALVSLYSFANGQISDDFEGGWDQTKWKTYAPDCNQGGSISLDTSTSHGGSASMKVVGAGGYCGHIFFGTTSVPSGDIYVRAWVKPSTALTASHVTFITMPDSGLGTNKHLRIGGQSQILMYNRETDDATLPDLSPNGIAASVALKAGQFQCLEYHLGKDGTIETWLDGTSISGLQAGPNASNPYSAQWGNGSYKPSITGIYFGWESYGGDANTFWYDDISIGSSRVGCGTSQVSSTTTRTTLSTSTTGITSVPSATTTKSSAAPTSTSAGQVKYGQCGGTGWTGPTTCESGSTCTYVNDWYSQCL